MKLQQLISAGFAITAFAAVAVPAVGWGLLGDAMLERPAAVSVPASWEAHPFLLADAALGRVVMGDKPDRDRTRDAAIRQ